MTTRNILKPDIAAPGDNILAAWLGNDPFAPRGFKFATGTSMACPHVSGVAATVKARYPGWSPAAIRSAIMTSAIQWNNMEKPLADEKGKVATPYVCGAGVLNPVGALDPGLVYDMGPDEYLEFLCFHGYNASLIKRILPSIPASFDCPKDSGSNRISEINYPSISVHKDVAASPVLVTRRLTNVADARAVYDVSVDSPAGELAVRVEPSRLHFSETSPRLTFTVSFSSRERLNLDAFGSITWSNGRHRVRIPFVVSHL